MGRRSIVGPGRDGEADAEPGTPAAAPTTQAVDNAAAVGMLERVGHVGDHTGHRVEAAATRPER